MKYLSTHLISLVVLCGCILFSGCVDQQKIKEELKAEMEQEMEVKKLQEENEKLKEQLDSKKEEAEKKELAEKVEKKTVQVREETPVVVPDKVKIHDADNAGVVLRTRPSDSTKLKGSGYPHFFTGYVFSCVGVSGRYYKVYFDGGYYFVPKRYASPYYGGSIGGPMSY